MAGTVAWCNTFHGTRDVVSKFFVTCPVEITFLQLLGNDDVIYEVIARKFRASVEPF